LTDYILTLSFFQVICFHCACNNEYQAMETLFKIKLGNLETCARAFYWPPG